MQITLFPFQHATMDGKMQIHIYSHKKNDACVCQYTSECVFVGNLRHSLIVFRFCGRTTHVNLNQKTTKRSNTTPRPARLCSDSEPSDSETLRTLVLQTPKLSVEFYRHHNKNNQQTTQK